MEIIPFANTGRQTTRLGFGGSGIMGALDRRQSLSMLRAAYDAGVRHFDTAPMYGYGEAESCLGEFLREVRGQVTITTKFGIPPPDSNAVTRLARVVARPVLQTFPGLKQVLRKTMHMLYVLLFSLIVVGERVAPFVYYGMWDVFGVRPVWLLAFWTSSLILDEWNQWVVNPTTFEVDLWNRYDYISLSSSSIALLIKLFVGPVEHAVEKMSAVINTSGELGRGLGEAAGGAAARVRARRFEWVVGRLPPLPVGICRLAEECAEQRVEPADQAWLGAKVVGQYHRVACQLPSGFLEDRDVAPSEAIDGLLGISDHEQARGWRATGTPEGPHDLPLGEVGVLEFIDHDVREALLKGHTHRGMLLHGFCCAQDHFVEV